MFPASQKPRALLASQHKWKESALFSFGLSVHTYEGGKNG